jgi:hypothetical protein
MGSPGEARITKKLLRESMTPAQYRVAFAYYEQMLKRQVEEDVPDGSTPTHGEPDAPEAVSVSESVAEPNAIADGLLAAKAKLRAEAASWGIAASEIEHILQHHPIPAAHNILWKARRQQNSTTLTASAAD